MKKISILLLSLLCLCCSGPKGRVVEHPEYVIRNKSVIDVSMIELSDTATVLHIYAEYTPGYWIQLNKDMYLTDNNGKDYAVLSGRGITLGEHFWMPESGEAEFQLVFPPLDRGVTSVDLVDDVDGGFKIIGIQLDGTLPKLKVPKDLKPADDMYTETIPYNELNYGTATVQGKVLDYSPSMGSKIRILANENIRNGGKVVYAHVQPDGSYKAEFKLTAPSQVSLIFSGSITWMVAEPGKTTQVYINMREAGRRESKFHADDLSYGELCYSDSPWTQLIMEYQKYSNEMFMYRNSQNNLDPKTLAGMDMHAYKEYQLKAHAGFQAKIDSLPICPATRRILTFDNRMDEFVSLFEAPGHIRLAQLGLGMITREQLDELQKDMAKEYPEGYFDNSYFEEMCDSRCSLFMRGYHAVYAQRAMGYQGVEPSEYPSLLPFVRTYMMMSDLGMMIPLTDGQKAEMKEFPQAYIDVLNDENDELLARLEADKDKGGYTIHETGDVSDEELFESIISKWRGKVIMVDFWGIGCHPCMVGHEKMAPVKEELKDRDVVWLYITDEDSPETAWRNTLTDIPGEHYRLRKSQWKHVVKELGFDGAIPIYLIIDRDGTIRYRQLGFSDSGHLRDELLKVLG